MHLGIDGNEANVVKRVGSNVFAFELLRALALSSSDFRYTIYLKSPPLPDLPPATQTWHYRVLRPGKLWTQWRLPLDLSLPFHRPQAFFSPGHYAPRFSPVPTVVTILDVAFLHFPALYLKHNRGVTQLSQWTEYSVRQAKHIFAISKFTQAGVAQAYGVPQDRITVIYPGVDHSFYRPPEAAAVTSLRRRRRLSRPYLFYLGTLQPRKNLDRLLHAFETLPPLGNKLDLVIAGGSGWLMDEFKAKVRRSPKADRIKMPGFVPRADLPAFYRGAVATVLVGLEEGFGLPPAEAMACGGIAIVSKTGALPEVVGQAGILVDPYSITSLRHGIIAAMSLTPEAKRRRIQMGQSHVKQFTWAKSAQIVRQVLYDLSLSR